MTERPARLTLRLLDDIIEGIRQFHSQLDEAFRKPNRFDPNDPRLTTALLAAFAGFLAVLLLAALLERL
ncbi:MAG: hypothetical protein WCE79_23075 [Xanthobacteraceae bacterium]